MWLFNRMPMKAAHIQILQKLLERLTKWRSSLETYRRKAFLEASKGSENQEYAIDIVESDIGTVIELIWQS